MAVQHEEIESYLVVLSDQHTQHYAANLSRPTVVLVYGNG